MRFEVVFLIWRLSRLFVAINTCRKRLDNHEERPEEDKTRSKTKTIPGVDEFLAVGAMH